MSYVAICGIQGVLALLIVIIAEHVVFGHCYVGITGDVEWRFHRCHAVGLKAHDVA